MSCRCLRRPPDMPYGAGWLASCICRSARLGKPHRGSAVMSGKTLLAFRPRHRAVRTCAALRHPVMSRQPRSRSSGKAPVSRQLSAGAAAEPASEPAAAEPAADSVASLERCRRRHRRSRSTSIPAISAGYIHDRYDLLVRGRVVSRRAGGGDRHQAGRCGHWPRSVWTVGPDGARPASRMANRHPARVPRQRAAAPRPGAPDVHLYHCCPHAEWRYPRAKLRVSRSIRPIRCRSRLPRDRRVRRPPIAHVRPPVVLYVERAALDDSGQLLVHGWAVSLTAMVTVQAFLDEERIGAAQLGGQRDDVGTAFPAYANARLSGFTLSKHIDVDCRLGVRPCACRRSV